MVEKMVGLLPIPLARHLAGKQEDSSTLSITTAAYTTLDIYCNCKDIITIVCIP